MESKFNGKSYAVMLQPLVSSGKVLRDTWFEQKRSILRQIDYQDLVEVEKGFGGRIGVLPRLSDGSYLINLSNRRLWSDFGGGVKAREYHLEALHRELEEEAPVWAERMLRALPNAEIYSLEEFYPYDFRKSKVTIRVMVLCIIDFREEWIAEFQPSPEVLELRRVTDSEMRHLLLEGPLNLGLQQLKIILE
jgi:8-oxo-dGTP pyrophosphatase MutT (NUDIX family)